MVRVAGGWARVGAPLLIACACGPRSLDRAADGGGGMGSVSPENTSRPGTSSADGGIGGGAGVGPGAGLPAGAGGGAGTGGQSAAACAPVELDASIGAPAVPTTRRPSSVPFSCQPLSAPFMFPRPSADTPGVFRRCASFQVGAAQQLAISPDGRFVALVPDDGVVRVVDVASRQVVTVLAPARATVDLAAFSPNGQAILTLASGAREVTLWGAGSFGKRWTTQLTGHRYQARFGGGGLAFAPDGRTAIVSAGQEVFLLDAGTGAVRAVRPAKGQVLRLAYGLGGARIVVADGSTTSDCAPGPSGGTVTILDAGTLNDVAEAADLGGRFDARGNLGLANFAVSPTDDLVLVPAGVGDPPGIRAVALSDGTALPSPGLDALPFAFMPDGAHLVIRAKGQLAVANRDDGAIVAGIADDGSAPIAVSADGRAIAIGGKGPDLLRVWQVGAAAPAAVCAAEDPGAPNPYNQPGVSLSADGQMIALGAGAQVRLFYTADGTSRRAFDLQDSTQAAHVLLSPDRRYLAAGPWPPAAFPTGVFSLQDGGSVAALPPDGVTWGGLAFTPAENKLYAIAHSSDVDHLYVARLDMPGLTAVGTFGESTSLLGFSQGCPVLYQASRAPWRACGGCWDPPVGSPGARAVLSPDGRLLAVGAAYPGPDMTVWPMQAGAAALTTIGPSAGDSAYQPLLEYPIAIAPGGGRVVSSSIPAYNCYRGPGLEVRIHDLATGALIDTLPPTPGYEGAGIAVDRDVRTIAYGPQLWCSDF